MKKQDWNELKSEPLFTEHIKTLQECSRDDAHEEYMTESQLLAVDFDDVKTAYTSMLGERNRIAASVDAMSVNISANGEPEVIVFIEFKNGELKKSEAEKVHNKVRDSILIFCDITEKTLRYTRQNAEFVLVYNKDINKNRLSENPTPSRDQFQDWAMEKAKEEPIYFGVDVYSPFFFRAAHTYTEEEFREYEKQLTSIV